MGPVCLTFIHSFLCHLSVPFCFHLLSSWPNDPLSDSGWVHTHFHFDFLFSFLSLLFDFPTSSHFHFPIIALSLYVSFLLNLKMSLPQHSEDACPQPSGVMALKTAQAGLNRNNLNDNDGNDNILIQIYQTKNNQNLCEQVGWVWTQLLTSSHSAALSLLGGRYILEITLPLWLSLSLSNGQV